MSIVNRSEDITNPRLRRLYEYWRSKHDNDKLPSRDTIDPLEIPDQLAHICLTEVIRQDDRLRFRYRLMGTAVTAAMGQDLTGVLFDEHFDRQYLDWIESDFNQVVESGQPELSTRSVPISSREFLGYLRLLLPLASDGRTVNMLLSSYAFDKNRLEHVPTR